MPQLLCTSTGQVQLRFEFHFHCHSPLGHQHTQSLDCRVSSQQQCSRHSHGLNTHQ